MNRDYVSPGLSVVVPDAHFPRMRVGDRANHPWKYFRREVPHHWYADERFPLMGFMNRDEATILYNIALQFAGKAALEIGSWLGWSTCHLALAGVRLQVIDPAHADPEFRAGVERSLAGCGVSQKVQLTAKRSPEGVHELASAGTQAWSLVVIDGDHEAPAPELDVSACLPYVERDCAFVFHDLASPAVAAGLRLLQREGFEVLVYQTQQIMGMAWRGNVKPVAHIPDPDVPWQLPHHLIGLPVSGIAFDTGIENRGAHSLNPETFSAVTQVAPQNNGGSSAAKQLRDLYKDAPGPWRPSVCIVSNEIIGPFKNGGIGTSMTGLAEMLADSGCRVTILYTGGVWDLDVQLSRWKKRYAELGIDFVAISIDEMRSVDGPVKNCGFGIPYLVYRYLFARHFDVVHFNDCTGEGNMCLAAKKMGLAFSATLLVVALHSPSQWVLELNQTIPTSLLLAAYNYAERLSVKCADVVWSPSSYLIDWARSRDFKLPPQTFIQQYCLPSQRLNDNGEGPAKLPVVRYGPVSPPQEIVFFGRLEERKGLRLFCNALNALRHDLASRNITVTFLGKPQQCGGIGSLEYIAQRSMDWEFPVQMLTNLGQPEALAYLLNGEKLAIIASPVDNSPCTVYEALAWGIPFLATHAGGIPELINDAHHKHVLFEFTTDALCKSLRTAINRGGWIAAPSQSQHEVRRVWSSFHADAKRYLSVPRSEPRAARVVAIVDTQSGGDLNVTLTSLAAITAVQRVVVLNRFGENPLPAKNVSLRNIDLAIDQPECLDEEIADVADAVILLVHAGISIRSDAFADMLLALAAADVDGLQPAAEVVDGPTRKTVLPLGGDPSFALFEGATFTGGLLVRGEALQRARLARDFTTESAFLGLADFCVTRGIEIWPYPEPVFERPVNWALSPSRPLPSRIKTFDECSQTDRYYMLAIGCGATNQQNGNLRVTALSMIDLGLLRLVRMITKTRRLAGSLRRRVMLRSPIDDYLNRLLRRNV